MMGKVNLFLVTISLGVASIYGSPLPARGYDPFRHEEVVVPVPIVYGGGDDSFENILSTGSYRYDVTSAEEEVKTEFGRQGSPPKAVSTSSTEDEEDDADNDEDPKKTIVDVMEDAMKGKLTDDTEDDDDDVDILTEGTKIKTTDEEDDEDDDDEDNEDEDEEGATEKVEGNSRQERYLFGSGINDSYGWYGWPNGHNHRRHHSHNHHHHHQPTYHHGFYTAYY